MMGRKRNLNSKRPYGTKSRAPRCPHCGKRTPRYVHVKCAHKPTFAWQQKEEKEEREIALIRLLRHIEREADAQCLPEIINNPEMYDRPLL